MKKATGSENPYSAVLAPKSFSAGDLITLETGAGVLHYAGAARVSHDGAFIDITDGVEIPSGSNVAQAVYAAIDGEFACVFAINYGKTRSAATGLRTLCGYRGLNPVLTTGDFILTEGFLHNRFGINSRRIFFPDHQTRAELAAVQPPEQTPALALITGDGLASYAFAVTGARALRTASWIGVGIHLTGGIVGLIMMLILAALGESQLLTPSNLFLYELIWMIPGFLITEWTRSL